MDITIHPRPLKGDLTAIPSKSQAHRLLICAAFADAPTRLFCPETNRDIKATAGCLRALGAQVDHYDGIYHVSPVTAPPEQAELFCHDSGSTLRFLLPVAGALGVDAVFHMEGRLPQRPLSPLWEEMERMGCRLSRPTEDTIRCQRKLRSGQYVIDGGVSSQFISGLLLATALIPGDSEIVLTGTVESRPYIEMTRQAMKLFGKSTDHFKVSGGTPFRSPGNLRVEGDWSNGAFFLVAEALGNDVQVFNLANDSRQGDRAIQELLLFLDEHKIVTVADIPDLVPIVAVLAACRKGITFADVRRLRLKESDRVASVAAMIRALGGKAIEGENKLTILGTGLVGGIVDSFNDHRIAMSAAIAATVCKEDVTILDAQCTEKSYPHFWEEYRRLGGNYEQYIR